VELELMKARIAFYFAAVVALVLFLAATVPSHATQHRDPSLTSTEMVQRPSQPNKPAHMPDLPAPKPQVTERKDGNIHNESRAKKASKRVFLAPAKNSAYSHAHATSSMGSK
jgi:hypothetical protein